MVALVAGNSLGLNLASLATLGMRGVAGDATLGRGTDRVSVNVANGNLVIQNQDDILAGPGLQPPRLASSGAIGQRNSSIVRKDADGNLLSLLADLNRTDRTGPGYATATYTHDAQHRLIATHRDGKAVEYCQYDAAGRVVMQDGGSLGKDIVDALNAGVPDTDKITVNTVLKRYDANGRLTFQQARGLDGQPDYDVDYSNGYDALGNLLRCSACAWSRRRLLHPDASVE